MSNESEVAEIFNNFFVTITNSLGIVESEDIVLPSEDISDPIDQILFRFSRHPSIQKIRSLNVNIGSFSFEKVSVRNMKNEVDGLNPSKSTTFKSIPPKLLKNESDLVSTPLQIIFDNSIEQSSFHDELKLADVFSLFKKEVKLSRVITDQLVFSLQYQRYLKSSLILRFLHTWLRIYHGFTDLAVKLYCLFTAIWKIGNNE